MKPDVHRLVALQKLLSDFTQVERSVHRDHLGKYVQENDVEHSYNLAMTAWYLSAWFPKLNKDRLIQYGLVHDMVEVYAGDTYLYGSEEDLASKEDREAKAFERLKDEWADFKDMIESIEAYETKQTPEAKFVYALDKLMPILLVYLHDGYSWREAKVTLKMLHEAKIAKVSLSPEILPYFEEIHAFLLDHPEFIQHS
jgi:putative hydrolases of HD superfamily